MVNGRRQKFFISCSKDFDRVYEDLSGNEKLQDKTN